MKPTPTRSDLLVGKPAPVTGPAGSPPVAPNVREGNAPMAGNGIPAWPAPSVAAPTMRDPRPVTRAADLDRGSQASVNAMVAEIDRLSKK